MTSADPVTRDRHSTRAEREKKDHPPWLERLAAGGEVRVGWHFSRQVWNRAAACACGLGAWGIVTGYAVFLLLWREGSHPWTFLLGLGLAAAAAYVVELARGVVEGHKSEPFSGSRLVITLLTLGIVELFVVAVHSVTAPSAAELGRIQQVVLGSVVGRGSPRLELFSLMTVWVLVGAGLAGALMLFVPETTGSLRKRIARGSGMGAAVGALGAPLLLLVGILVIRVVGLLGVLVTRPGDWAGHVRGLRADGWFWRLVLSPLEILGKIWDWRPFADWIPVGPIVVVVLVIGAVGGLKEKPWPVIWTLVAIAAAVLAALFSDILRLLELLGLAAAVWLIPSGAIGAIAPVLRRPSEDVRTWGTVAFLAGSALMVLTIVGFTSWWFLIPAVLLLFTWFVLRSEKRLKTYWPLVALTVALVVAGVTWAGQRTFAGVYAKLGGLAPVGALLEKAPPPAPDRIRTPLGRDSLDLLGTYSFGKPAFRGLSGFGTATAPVDPFRDAVAKAITRLYELRNTWQSDVELEGFSNQAQNSVLPGHEGDPQAVRQTHERWRRIRTSRDPLERLNSKRALRKETQLGFRDQLRIGHLRHQYLNALAGTLDFDIQHGDLASKLEDQWRSCSLRSVHGAREDSAAIWDDLAKLLEKLNGPETRKAGGEPKAPEAVAILERIMAEARPVLVDLERQAVGGFAELRAMADSRPVEQKLDALGRILEAQRVSEWKTQEGIRAADAEVIAAVAALEVVGSGLGDLADLDIEDLEARALRADQIARAAVSESRPWRFAEARTRLAAVRAGSTEVAEKARFTLHSKSSRFLEVALGGSLGFWVSVGMLLGFSLLRTRGRTAKGLDGRTRCFWATASLVAYHDNEHGVAPATDRDFFRRLAREIILKGESWEKLPWVVESLHDFDPAFVATLAVPPAAGGVPVNVIENAQRLIAWYARLAAERRLDAVPDSSGTALLDDLRARLEAGDPEALVAHFRSIFSLETTTPVATFLQSVGILKGAHFEGCERAREA